ncbi:hypothetical protein E0500_023515 [Streptomyces sp. KM273126]|uniref:hypothetical protein n=1 Tax=Streptomyces sp. KM273126 TaxID=2545247 RepID=UPI00103CB95F|nr:hypothetical protein [Streptomyces sp. KM273126]MBA2810278.1 hypothetical protein [Streptomyces sp. KM273126]
MRHMVEARPHVDERLSMGGDIDEAATARGSLEAKDTVTCWNAGAEQLLGYGATEMLPRWNGRVALRDRDGRRVEVPAL